MRERSQALQHARRRREVVEAGLDPRDRPDVNVHSRVQRTGRGDGPEAAVADCARPIRSTVSACQERREVSERDRVRPERGVRPTFQNRPVQRHRGNRETGQPDFVSTRVRQVLPEAEHRRGDLRVVGHLREAVRLRVLVEELPDPFLLGLGVHDLVPGVCHRGTRDTGAGADCRRAAGRSPDVRAAAAPPRASARRARGGGGRRRAGGSRGRLPARLRARARRRPVS